MDRRRSEARNHYARRLKSRAVRFVFRESAVDQARPGEDQHDLN